MTRKRKKALPEKTKTQGTNSRQRSKNDAEKKLLTPYLLFLILNTMIDLKRARADVAAYKEVIRLRNLDIDFDAFLELEAEKNTLLQQIDELRNQKNVLSKEIPTLSADTRDIKIAESKKIGEDITKLEEEAKVLEEKYTYILHRLPNFLDDTAAR